MKKLRDIDFRVFNNSVHLFSPIMYSLRDIEEIIFLSRVTPLSPTRRKILSNKVFEIILLYFDSGKLAFHLVHSSVSKFVHLLFPQL